ncbi:MAG: PQQ-binding-like beta-propeller repeat protein [Acidobacteria bacterium]|nr:PQQ-binding-like beta-propeller repeat protein [Acidobacteriota bacterium]
MTRRQLLASLAVAAVPTEDPAPPKVFEPDAGAGPSAQKNPATKFHGKPKPLPAGAVTEDWPHFLGPTRNMVSTETKLLAKMPEEGPPLLWEFAKGTGYSGVSVVDDRLLFLHRLGDEERVVCLHPETGDLYWTFAYPTTFSDRYGYNNGPRSTPAIDGERVYAYGAQGKLHCLQLTTGKLLWGRDLAKEFEVPQDFFGTATSPLVEKDRVIVNIGAPGGPTVVALDKLTGRMLWGAGEEWGPSYATPMPAVMHGKPRVMVFAGGESRPPTGGLLSIDPANGAVDFSFPWRSRSYESVNASTPLILGDRVMVSAAYRTGAAMLRVRPDFSYEELWTSDELDLHWTTPMHKNGYLYAFAGRNEPDAGLLCVDAATGKTVWRQVLEWEEVIEIQGEPRKIYESPFRGFLMAVDGRFLAQGEHGHLLWMELSPEGPEILSRGEPLLARETWTPPALSRGLLYMCQNTRTFDGSSPRLLCLDLRAA